MKQHKKNANGEGVKFTDLLAAACPECGSTDTEWHCSQHTSSGVMEGRLRTHEVSTQFFLGCNHCSETIRIISGNELARLMTEAANGVFRRAAPKA